MYKIQYIRWDLNLYLKDNMFSGQRLGQFGHADSQRNKSNYNVVILKEKSLSRQSRERVFWQFLIVSCKLTDTKWKSIQPKIKVGTEFLFLNLASL